jgi:hypothetical protein
VTPKPPEADFSKIRTVPIARRDHKVNARDLAQPPGTDRSFRAFLDSLPDILEARSFNAVVDAMVAAARGQHAVVCMLGGHVIKTGLAPVLIDLMRRGVITHLASNGSAVIHDFEMACFGATSEDVEAGLKDGSFGMADETGQAMNEAMQEGMRQGWGLGESLARALEQRTDLIAAEQSLLLQSRKLGVQFTVHAAIGAEIIHQHPAARRSARRPSPISNGWRRTCRASKAASCSTSARPSSCPRSSSRRSPSRAT